MSDSPASTPTPPSASARRWWLRAVGLRLALSIVALPLTPLLFREQLIALVAMRPTREFLLLGGFQVRSGQVELLWLLLASLPMVLLGNWVFFGLGRAYRAELESDDPPAWLTRYADPDQVERLRRVLARKGTLIVILARLAIFPTTLLAAAAGASRMPTRRFLVADTLSASLAYVEYVGAGYVLGRAYESAGPWITVAGVAGLALILWVIGRAMREEDVDAPDGPPADELAWPSDPEPDTSPA